MKQDDNHIDTAMHNEVISATCRQMIRFFYVVVSVICAPFTVVADNGRFEITLSGSEEYTSNVDLEPDAEKDSALITRLSPRVQYRKRGGGHVTAINFSGTLRHQTAGEDEGYNFDIDAAATSTMELINDRIFVDLGASLSQQVLSSSLANSEANQRLVQIYRFSPVYRTRIGSYADGEVRYSLNQVFLEEDVSDETQHVLSAILGSGDRFDRVNWSLSGFGAESVRDSANDISRYEIEASGEYGVSRYLFVDGAAGYQSFDDRASTKFDKPIWQVGVRLRPSKKLNWRIGYGLRDDDHSVSMDMRYEIGTRTTFSMGYHEGLSTAQERLTRNLTSIGFDQEQDTIIDSRTETAFNPKTDPFDIDDSTDRVKRFDVRFRHRQKRNLFTFSGTLADEIKQGTGEEESNLRFDFTWRRKLRRDLDMSLSLGFERIDFDTGQQDDEILASTSVDYRLTSDLNLSASYFFRNQTSDNPQSEFTDHRLTVGVRKKF